LAAAVPLPQLPQSQPSHPPNRHKITLAIAEIAANFANSKMNQKAVNRCHRL